jgi:hypothetical protein
VGLLGMGARQRPRAQESQQAGSPRQPPAVGQQPPGVGQQAAAPRTSSSPARMGTPEMKLSPASLARGCQSLGGGRLPLRRQLKQLLRLLRMRSTLLLLPAGVGVGFGGGGGGYAGAGARARGGRRQRHGRCRTLTAGRRLQAQAACRQRCPGVAGSGGMRKEGRSAPLPKNQPRAASHLTPAAPGRVSAPPPSCPQRRW